MTYETPNATQLHHLTLILGIINTNQPTNFDFIAENTPIDQELLSTYLTRLERNGLVKSFEGQSYRVTWRGQRSFWSKRLQKQRDVARMWHLSELSDLIRNTKEGEGAQ